MRSAINRREFLQVGALGATGTLFRLKTEGPAVASIPPSDRVTVGMVACGARAHQLIETVKQIEGVEIVALYDAYSGRARRAQGRTAGKATIHKDYREIFARPDVDVVVISSPDHWHKRQAVEAAEAGKHMYIEKPLTYTVEEGLDIIRAAEKHRVALQVGSSGMSSPLAEKARDMIKAGRLGQVTMVRAYNNRNTASGAWIYPIPPDASPETVDWGVFLGSAPARPFDAERFFRWRCFRDYSGGMSTDLFVHLCTTINYVMDAPMADRAVAMGGLYRWVDTRDVPDTINASLAYPEGFMVSLSGTANNEAAGGPGIQFLGTEGTLTLGRDLTFEPENVVESNGWIVDSWPEELAKAYYEDPEVQRSERPATRPPQVKAGTEIYRSEGLDATNLHFRDLFEAVRNGKSTRQDARVGHHAASCAHLVNLSLDRGAEVRWDAARDSIAAS